MGFLLIVASSIAVAVCLAAALLWMVVYSIRVWRYITGD